MRRFPLAVFGALTVAVLCGSYWLFQSLVSARTHDWTSEWPRFYKESFSAHFRMPDEVEIVSAIQTRDPIMGEYDRVVFRLPRTKTPSDWLWEIAKASGIGRFRQSDIWYDASHLVDGRPSKYSGTPTDDFLIRYRPNDQTYEAIWGWD